MMGLVLGNKLDIICFIRHRHISSFETITIYQENFPKAHKLTQAIRPGAQESIILVADPDDESHIQQKRSDMSVWVLTQLGALSA